jgi:2-polyprenyl-6-methoxyphenol hydroxylase-like FAD-dependent oxidoreductase
METYGAVFLNHITRYNDEGVKTKVMHLAESNKLWQHPWQLSHRVHLHEALKQAAISKHGVGKPAVLHTSSRVTNVDTENAIITLENGKTIKADAVLGADGVYSKMRSFVSGESQIYGSGKAAFRFLVAREKALENPETTKLVELDGEMAVWYGSDRRVVMYPCDHNRLLNFACIHPDTESQGGADGKLQFYLGRRGSCL